MNPYSTNLPMRALIVDSDPAAREAFSSTLFELGVDSQGTRGYLSGMKAFRDAVQAEYPFGFVFVSAQLVTGGAFDFFRFIHAEDRRVKLILLANPESLEILKQKHTWEFRSYDVTTLMLPVDVDELRAIVFDTSSNACSMSYSAPDSLDDEEPPPPATRAKNSSTEPLGPEFVAPAEDQRDDVDCTVYAPPTISAGETIMVQAMLHLPEEAALAAALARQFDDTSTARGTRSLDTSIARRSRVAFQLTAPSLEIDDATPPPIVWRGRPTGVQFGVTAPNDSISRTVLGTVLVTLESVPIGHFKFKLSVLASVSPTINAPAQTPTTTASSTSQPHKMSRYQMIFISYASPDRDEVLKRVQMLKRFGISFFQDVLNLEPGERWEQSLYKHIDESDLFLLFWSTAAKNSPWVREEVKYALGLHENNAGEFPEIVPIVLEGPPVPEPLPELSHLHFNDQILHFVADRYSSTHK